MNILAAAPGLDYPSGVAPWSLLPILCVVLSIPTYFLVYFLTKYLVKKKLNIIISLIIFAYGLIFLGLEVFHEVTRAIDLGYYDWSSFPFQFCSIPIYFCLIMPWLKKGVVRDSFFYYMSLFCLISGSFPLLVGQDNMCRWPTVVEVFRSFLWHILILQVCFICFAAVPVGRDLKKDWRPLVGALGIFVSVTIVAQLVNVTLHYMPNGGASYPLMEGAKYPWKNREDYQGQYWDPDTVSAFYISPFFQSNMPVFSLIWEKCGWVVNWILYDLSFMIGVTAIYFIFFGVKYGFNKHDVYTKCKTIFHIKEKPAVEKQPSNNPFVIWCKKVNDGFNRVFGFTKTEINECECE